MGGLICILFSFSTAFKQLCVPIVMLLLKFYNYKSEFNFAVQE